MTLLTATAYAPLFDQRAVHAHYLHVRSGFRGRGVGKALLAAAVSFADEAGAEHVLTSRRSVPVSVLRRRLAGPSAPGVAEHLVARRKTLRRVRDAVARAAD